MIDTLAWEFEPPILEIRQSAIQVYIASLQVFLVELLGAIGIKREFDVAAQPIVLEGERSGRCPLYRVPRQEGGVVLVKSVRRKLELFFFGCQR